MKLNTLPHLVLCGIVILFTMLTGCSSNSSNDSSTQSEATLSGSISFVNNTQNSNRLNSIISEGVDPENYILWLQNRGSGRVHFIDLDENGEFTLPVTLSDQTLGKNFILGVVQKEPLTYIGTIYQTSSSNSELGYTGFDIEGSISDLAIEFDLNNFHGLVQNIDTISSLNVNTDLKVRLDNTAPSGASNAGKGAHSKTTELNSVNSIDKDEDGVPDIFDAMNDGQHYDNANENNKVESTLSSDSLISAIMFTNLKIDEANEDDYTVTESAVVVIEVVPAPGSSITSIESDLRHTHFNDSTLDRLPSSYTEVDTYGAENSLWSDSGSSGYTLYKALTPTSETRWTVLIKPNNNDFESGDLVRLKVTLASGDIEYYFVGFNFKFESIVDSTTTAWTSGAGERNDPYEIPETGDLDLTWTLPQDEDGNDILGLSYQFELFYYDTDENQIDSMTVYELPGEDITSGTLPSAYIDAKTPTPSFIQLDINARFPYGDNSANKIYFRRTGWPAHTHESGD